MNDINFIQAQLELQAHIADIVSEIVQSAVCASLSASTLADSGDISRHAYAVAMETLGGCRRDLQLVEETFGGDSILSAVCANIRSDLEATVCKLVSHND